MLDMAARTIRRADGQTMTVTVVRYHGYNPGQARDQIGHWVKPPSMREHPCPHSCCRDARVHPANLPVRLSRDYLRGLSEPELERELSHYQNYADSHERGFLQVIAELGRREDRAERVEARRERARGRRRRLNAEHRDEVYRQWLQAEAATRGVMLNKAGQRAGIDERSLFTGPESRVVKYASPELFEWFEEHGRPTRAAFLGSARERKLYYAGRRIG
jgi:hypothetical protein